MDSFVGPAMFIDHPDGPVIGLSVRVQVSDVRRGVLVARLSIDRSPPEIAKKSGRVSIAPLAVE